jgi:hypothetical protein
MQQFAGVKDAAMPSSIARCLAVVNRASLMVPVKTGGACGGHRYFNGISAVVLMLAARCSNESGKQLNQVYRCANLLFRYPVMGYSEYDSSDAVKLQDRSRQENMLEHMSLNTWASSLLLVEANRIAARPSVTLASNIHCMHTPLSNASRMHTCNERAFREYFMSLQTRLIL